MLINSSHVLAKIIYSTAKSEVHVYDETRNFMNFVLMSLTECYLQQIMQISCKVHLLRKVSIKSILVTNIEWENPQPMRHVVILT